MRRLIECVPNFSEGRDLAKVDALVDAMSGVPGAWVLDRTSDADHNRSVITLAGEPDAVAEAALRGVGAAAKLIDLTKQIGAHPRIGATDVLPFVPLEGYSIDECVALAGRVGHEIWTRFEIPVYFYEMAATRPERVNLENVRRGQFEGLLQDALRDPDRSPDIGEPRLHSTAGAIAVGVRKILIAYNIHLSTNDVAIARDVARAIRFSSGGLRYVKAIGIDLKGRGLAQVSINLTDFEQTPLHRVFEMVKREAERHGCTVVGSEIIGLIPRKSLEASAEYYLQLENFSPARVLENRLASVSGDMPGEPSGPKRSGTVAEALLQTLRDASRECAGRIASGAESGQKSKNLSETESEFRGSMQQADRYVIEANLETALAAVQIYEQWVQLEAVATPSMLSDLRIGRLASMAAARAALETVEAGLSSFQTVAQSTGRDTTQDLDYVSRIKSRVSAIEARLSSNSVIAGN
jgi:glutamate formiminotransferase